MTDPEHRWPSSVYAHGHDPDPRFSLANERTFLAWIRTALALVAGAPPGERGALLGSGGVGRRRRPPGIPVVSHR